MTDQPGVIPSAIPPSVRVGKARPRRSVGGTRRFGSKTTFAVVTAIFLVALALRLIPTTVLPSIAFPDEIFQTLEQAHRLVFGYGSVPWEFQYGTRSWLLPGVLAGLMRIGAWVGNGPVYYLAVIHLALAALAAGACVCAYLWGRRFYGTWGGVIAAALPVMWPDNVYFGARTLSECVAAPLLVIGIYLTEPGYRVESRWRLAVAGALLGLAVAIRLQLAPAVGVVMLWTAFGVQRRRLPPIIAGVTSVLLTAGGLDAVTWGYPFESVWRNFEYNLLYGVSNFFGTEPWYFYFYKAFYYWNAFAIAIPLLALWGARRVPVVILAAAAILLAHSLIAHKEFRFIYPAILLLTIAAGIGIARLVSQIAATWRFNMAACAPGALLSIIIVTALVASAPPYQALWLSGRWVIEADRFVSKLKGVCGLGAWMGYAGQTYVHRDVPVYFTIHDNDVARYGSAFNTLITANTDPPAPGDFRPVRCFGQVCVSQRIGVCVVTTPEQMPVPPPVRAISAHVHSRYPLASPENTLSLGK